MTLEEVYIELDNSIIKLCNDVNKQMDWMKQGVRIAFIPAWISLVISLYLLWKSL